MGAKGRCSVVLISLVATSFLTSVAAQEQVKMKEDFSMFDSQQSDAGRPYLPKFLKEKYGKSLSQPVISQDDLTSEEKKGGPDLNSRMFSGGSDASFRKSPPVKSSYGRGRNKADTSAEVADNTGGFTGGCSTRPNIPTASLRCSPYSGCRATCPIGYKFSNGEQQLFVKCEDGEWHVEGEEPLNIPHCQPVCLPACQHNGICVGPNQCNCAPNYSGPQCQFEKKPCLNHPTLPANSRRMCSTKACTITCAVGFQFPDGSAIANMMCKDGAWVPSRPDWVAIPDCEAVCEPGCQNGGNCLSFNVCQCPQDFTGPQCQYRMDACTSKKLNFNGGYSCSGNEETFSCSVSCPSGVPFEYDPAPLYTCRYSTGVFEPAPIPQCVFGENAEIIEGVPIFSSNFTAGSAYSYSDYEEHRSDLELHSSDYDQQSSAYSHGGYDRGHRQHNATMNTGVGRGYGRGSRGRQKSPHRVTVIAKRPAPGVCYTWGGGHYKSFDGKIISFDSDCSFTLVRDSIDNTFSVNLVNKNGRRSIQLFAQDKEYLLTLNDVGIPVLEAGKRRLAIPSHLSGLTTEFIAHYVVSTLTGLGVKLQWDAKNFVSVDVTESLWNRTAGLCGRIDGHVDNDLEMKNGVIVTGVPTFVNSWQVQNLEESCNTSPIDESSCGSPTSPLAQAAARFCSPLLNSPRLSPCRSLLEPREYYEACVWDYCACTLDDKRLCACDTMAVFVRECRRHKSDAVAEWRDAETCPVECTGGRVYLACGPAAQGSCGSAAAAEAAGAAQRCEEGCYCPADTVLHDGACIRPGDCPCQLRGKSFPAGAKIPKDCNTCTCASGQWVCTQVLCGSRCGSVGDPHYVTFDGKHYDFMGTCSYYLVKGDDYSIEAENVACAGTISQSMGFALSSTELPSCTKTVTIRVDDKTIKLKQKGEVLVDGQEVLKLPFNVAGAYVHVVSSVFLMVDLPNGVSVWWDGVTRVYVDAPAAFQGKTKGLCGTFNLNQKDDFLTPEGDVEQSVPAFANKWKTSEQCSNVPEKIPSHPCDVNVHNKATAEKHCSKIKGNVFQDCHWNVDPEQYYQDCLYDVCSCESKVGDCLCPIMAAYGKQCTLTGVRVNWREHVRECGVHCTGGQKYQVCGNTCARSCYDISHYPDCRRQCVEGCNCPEGETMDGNGECIPVGQCLCSHSGIEYPAGYMEVRPGTKGLELCECERAVWECRPASDEEAKEYPKTESIKSACSHLEHQTFTQCEPSEPVTCQNMHSPPRSTPAVCQAGCVCAKGYVLDSYTKQCILPAECPCHHGAKSYAEGQSMQEDCNTCTCLSGKWKCTERVCAGMCTAWGDSHFKTFDGRIYDFHGTCDYVLVKGHLSKDDSFDVTIQNVPCSSSGISCSKSVSLKVGSGSKQETITFARDKPVPSFIGLERIIVREAGLFLYAEVFDLGLVLQWDRGTRVYVKTDPKWKNKLKGLCGNYNNNEMDDFETPSGGVSESSASVFGDSWRLQDYCPEAAEFGDSCVLHPHRRTWAVQKCGILKSEVFSPCHSEVPLDAYLERCIFDACACDLGGDCECLCTAIAAYSHECNLRGVPLKWRTQHTCPVQCDERCARYSPCVETCPRVTCENQYVHKAMTQLCAEDACVEGCAVDPCPAGQVYNNLTTLECVPLAACKTVCLQIGDVIYYEGDEMSGDECHTCFCSRHKETCTGQPCPATVPTTAPPPPTTTTTTLPTSEIPEVPPVKHQEIPRCVDGWSVWLNSHKGKGYGDVEPVPTKLQLMNAPGGDSRKSRGVRGMCDREDMSGIRCRKVGTHESATDVGQNVKCSLDGGLLCVGACHDFEISVLCDCGFTTAPPLEMCDVARPNRPHPSDCHLFHHCLDTPVGVQYVEKSCGPTMMYNPEAMVCDWPASVAAIRPDCGVLKKTTKTTTTTTTTTTPPPVSACYAGWSAWFNTTATPEGDFESLDEFELSKALPCSRDKITDIECEFYKVVTVAGTKSVKGRRKSKIELVDYKESGNKMTCSPTTGLRCANREQRGGNKCEDYTVRVFCQCHETTKPARVTIPARVTTPEPTTVEYSCPPSQQWSKCAIPCSQMCHYYGFYVKREGLCADGQTCISGCVDLSISRCPPRSLWRDKHSCVKVSDCTCRDSKGNPVKPGAVTREGCEVCQCVNNEYVCDTSSCEGLQYRERNFTEKFDLEVTRQPPKHYTDRIYSTPPILNLELASTTEPTEDLQTTVPSFVIVPSTVTPAELCQDDLFVYMVEELDPYAFSASSSLAPLYEPQHAKLNSKVTPTSGGSWVPNKMNADQYLQVDLGHNEPIYGVVTQGSPIADDYVTSYKVLVGSDEDRFSYIMDQYNQPATFRGPIDGDKPVKQMFAEPVEARFVRFNPSTFHGAIAMRVEVIGCGITATTTGVPSIVEPEICMDDMGLDNGMMSDQQISVSSVLNDDWESFGPSQVRPASSGWIPNEDNYQWIMFDFLEPRNLTGITTYGEKEGDRWVEAYNVKYSHDRKAWNPIVDMDFSEKVFYANFDSDTPAVNMFDSTLQAQYLKLVPIKWHNGIALRCQVEGCYLPYPELPTPPAPEPTIAIPADCRLCPGQSSNVELIFGETCSCPDDKWWDGKECIYSTECPCYVGHISYAVGGVYVSEDCQQCVCRLNGLSECAEKPCEECNDGLQSVKTVTCGCVCKPCPEGTVYCSTSNICIEESFWCDGIQHCPDDEVNCVTTTVQPPTTIKLKDVTTKPCPKIACPPGYKLIEKKFSNIELVEEQSSSDKSWAVKGTKGGRKGGVKGGVKGVRAKPVKLVQQEHDDDCPQFECEPIPPVKVFNESKHFNKVTPPPCPTPECPLTYKLEYVLNKVPVADSCPRYKCEPPVVPDAACSVTERSFHTFDGTEFKYDVCDHVIARDQDTRHNWEITMLKSYQHEAGVYQRQVAIRQDSHVITLHPNLTVECEGYAYTAEQANSMPAFEAEFEISRNGDALLIRSNRYQFWLTWDVRGNLKIWVSGKLSGHVSGLCGFFNEVKEDDKRKPDGKMARTTAEFGDSWTHGDTPADCAPVKCPMHRQVLALAMCEKAKLKPFSRCAEHMNVERFISHCVESACSCLEAGNATDCECQALLSYVTECEAANPNVDLSGWRADHNCPVKCSTSSKDCYRRSCQISCDNLMEDDPCPQLDNICFPGCYCPDGLVRNGEDCVKPVQCRDCVCDGFGDPQYVNFDRSNFTFNGNCTYVAARDISPTGDHAFQVLVTNGPCAHKPGSTCTDAVTINYGPHSVHIRRDHADRQLVTLLDGETVNAFPVANDWLLIETIPGKEVTVVIPPIQLEVTFIFQNYAFIIRLPSHLYKGNTEGLCGNCNRDKSDDLMTSGGVLTENVDDFGLSWLQADEDRGNCFAEKIEECQPLPPEQDPCLAIMDSQLFGKCHALINPVPYLVTCQTTNCHTTKAASACSTLEAYARECWRQEICVDWRSDGLCPYNCEEGTEYQACGPGCRKTCVNHLQLESDPSSCQVSPIVDGCYCPTGQVLHNGACQPTARCSPCDLDDHFDGDEWSPDKCTKCSCVGTNKLCGTTQCTTAVCDGESDAVMERGTEDDCCPKYLCVPTPKVGGTCPTPQQPECGFAEILKLETLSNGCQLFVCKCKPADECEPMVENEVDFIETLTESSLTAQSLGEGWEKVINYTGCCPQMELVCNQDKCRQPADCQQHYERVKLPLVQGACCPDYACEPPRDMCLYEFEYTTDELLGGEQPTTESQKYTVVKEPGSTWLDGPCRSCTCTGSSPGEYRAVCSVESCTSLSKHSDAAQYVLKAVPAAGKCCPDVVRTACIGPSGAKLEIGAEAAGKRCEMLACVASQEGAQLQKTLEKCNTDCQLGARYEPAPKGGRKCCGTCRQVECVHAGAVHPVGSDWQSDDHCVNYHCVDANNTARIESTKTKCANVSAEIGREYVVEYVLPPPGQCCKTARRAACRVGGERYVAGETWPDPEGDRCKSVTCVAEAGGEVTKKETIQTCNEECDKGWQYFPSPLSSPLCCGKCRQVACVVDGEIREAGATWASEDNCTTFACGKHKDQMHVTAMQMTCPNVDDCPVENLYTEGCCKLCKIEASSQRVCAPEDVNELTTVDIIQETKGSHGRCANLKPVKLFKECRGGCDSYTQYDMYTFMHVSKCTCCQATAYTHVTAELTCADGHRYEKVVSVPSECACLECGTKVSQHIMKIPTAAPKGGGVKTGRKGGYGSDVYNAMRTQRRR